MNRDFDVSVFTVFASNSASISHLSFIDSTLKLSSALLSAVVKQFLHVFLQNIPANMQKRSDILWDIYSYVYCSR